MLTLFTLYENLTNFAFPLCSALPDRPYPETPVSQSSNIVDISKVGLKQFWNLRNHMQDASQLATAYYPETLDRIFIIGAPSFFPTVWSWIKAWFDPITVSKIFILNKSNMKSTLEQYVAPENIPKKYGGLLDYEFGDLPNLDPIIDKVFTFSNPAQEKGRKTFPAGPIRWKRGAGSDIVAVAVGSEAEKARQIKIGTLQRDEKTAHAPLGAGEQRNSLQIYRTTSGQHTHPDTSPAEVSPVEPPPTYTQPEVAASAAPAPAPALDLPPNTYIIPVHQKNLDDSMAQPQEYTGSSRGGTSSTRFEQQNFTNAKGTMGSDTPNMRSSGDGDKHGVMEPGTVGQAPKEHPMPPPEEPAQPSYMAQAQNMAGDAYESAAGAAGAAMSAVGMGGGEKKTEAEEGNKVPEDPRVDQAQEKNVEEFLRSQYPSKGAAAKTAKEDES